MNKIIYRIKFLIFYNIFTFILDPLNFTNSKSICYKEDEEIGDIFAKKQQNGKYKLEFFDEIYKQRQIIEYKDIEVTAGE